MAQQVLTTFRQAVVAVVICVAKQPGKRDPHSSSFPSGDFSPSHEIVDVPHGHVAHVSFEVQIAIVREQNDIAGEGDWAPCGQRSEVRETGIIATTLVFVRHEITSAIFDLVQAAAQDDVIIVTLLHN